MSILCRVDDKLVPLYRVVWIAATPHFCGDEECLREGFYEIRLEQAESVWANMQEQAELTARLEQWQGGMDSPENESGETPW